MNKKTNITDQLAATLAKAIEYLDCWDEGEGWCNYRTCEPCVVRRKAERLLKRYERMKDIKVRNEK